MTEHQALYRRWRPQQFAQVVNQEYTIKTLVNALSSNEIGHAYLFAGPRGTGKTTVARLFAKAVNCEQRLKGEPCNRCGACERIARGASLDVVEIDGASNRGIDQIRKLREEVNFVPADVKYKVYIIDEVHMLTNEAFNALLKTLEEPPKRVIFIFATTEPHRLPATVTSRCQAFAFTRITLEDTVANLKQICEAEHIQADELALLAIASRSGGALRDAQVTLEQVAAFAQGDPITRETLETLLGLPSEEMLTQFLGDLLQGRPEAAVDTLRDLSARGRDLELFLEELIRLSRDWLIQAVGKDPAPVAASPEQLVPLTQHLLALKREMGRVWDKQIWLEVGVLQFIQSAAPSSAPPTTRPADPAPPAQQAQAAPQQATAEASPPVDAGPPTAAEAAPRDHSAAAPATASQPPQTEPEPATETSALSASDEGSKAPTVAPETPAEAGDGPVDPDTWKALLESIREDRRVAVYAYLVEAHPRQDGDHLSIHYVESHRFHKESLEKAEIKSYVTEKVKALFGPQTTISIRFADAASSDAITEAAAQPSQLEEKTELTKRVLDGDRIQ